MSKPGCALLFGLIVTAPCTFGGACMTVYAITEFNFVGVLMGLALLVSGLVIVGAVVAKQMDDT